MVTSDNTSDSESSQSIPRGRANSYDSNDSDDSIRSIPGELEELLSQELMRMSITNRNLIHEEVHGVRCMAVEETPGLIRKSLQAFQRELDNDEPQGGISISEKKVYLKLLQRYRERSSIAAASGSTYTNYAIDDDDFRLRFLRCERFNPSKAARRFCNYLDCAYHHFGELTLERPVRITDFSRDERKTFRRGYLQFLPFRDSSGRRVLTMLGGLGAELDLTLRDKLFFYMFDVATRDSVESQQKGMIIIRFFNNYAADKDKGTGDQLMVNFKRKNDIRKAIKNAARVIKSSPTRIVAFHMDLPDHPILRLFGKHMFLKVFSGSDFGLPSRFVLGSGKGEMEFRYQLKSFGIPVQLLPLTETHIIKTTFHNQWMETRRKLEYQEFGKDERDCDGTDDNNDDYDDDDYDEADEYIKEYNQGGNVAVATLVECPGLNDVVFRKGSRVTSIENPGNRFFRELIRTFLDEKEKETQKLRQRQEEVMTHITEQIQHSKYAANSDVNTFVIRNESNRGDSASNDIYATCTSNKKASTPPTTPLTASASALAFETTKAMTRTPNSSSIAKKNTEKGFCDWLVDYIQKNCNGRFLEWEPRICGWVVMTNKMKIRRKVSITLYNWGKRLKTLAAAARLENSEALKKRTAPIQNGNIAIMNGKESSNLIHSTSDDESKGGHGNDMSYAFINNWRRSTSTSQQQWGFSCTKNSAPSNNNVQNFYANYVETILDSNKRARKDADYVYPQPVFSLPPSLS